MAHFDDAAVRYDTEFSRSEIGSRLRRHVWKMLDKEIDGYGLDILEINCGTGEDALYLAAAGHKVTATDASAEMIDIARKKIAHGNPSFEVMDFNCLHETFKERSFDIVFSNFGGLNCACEGQLKNILADVYTLLRPGGKFIGVLMGTGCAWEIGYHLLKMEGRKAFRRFEKAGVKTQLGTKQFHTYYYSPSSVKQLAPAGFKKPEVFPVGFFIPPTYMEHYFVKHPSQLDMLSNMERKISKLKLLSNFADHYMAILRK
jgi:ubiquinone/menaquinone biosynthesis C-methylase UbiE